MTTVDVFISYAREDKPIASQLAKSLEARGWTVWYDHDMHSGQRFHDVIEEQLNTARCIVVLWSRASIRSDFVRDEAEAAKQRQVLFPANIEDVRPPLGFRSLHTSNMVGWDQTKKLDGYNELINSLQAKLGTSPEEPPPQPVGSEKSDPKIPGSGTKFNLTLVVFSITLGLSALYWGWPSGDDIAQQKPAPKTTLVENTEPQSPPPIAAVKAMPTPLAVEPVAMRIIQDEMRSGGSAPEMVVIPAGRFLMGSPATESERRNDEGPQHEVSIPAFAIGRSEVTFAQYDRFAEETGRKKPVDEGWGREQRPVINVSWDDAQAYARWLSEQTGKAYRLPTEAEWEYAARGGTTTARFWGNEASEACRYANVYDQSSDKENNFGIRAHACDDQSVFTAPVANYTPNAYGLYDMLGNVWEWTADCWHGDYRNAPTDGSAWLGNNEGDCGRRVLRGGGWSSRPALVRSASRLRNQPDGAIGLLGFRLARTL